jgi:hypothetical protein
MSPPGCVRVSTQARDDPFAANPATPASTSLHGDGHHPREPLRRTPREPATAAKPAAATESATAAAAEPETESESATVIESASATATANANANVTEFRYDGVRSYAAQQPR